MYSDSTTSYAATTAGGVPGFFTEKDTLSLPVMLLLSVLTHLLVIGITGLLILLLQFFGFHIPLFNPLALKPRQDIEFVLVENPPEQPRDKNTKLRADRATRSGGERIPNKPLAEPQQSAGAPASQQPAQPQPQPAQPKQQTAKTTPQPAAKPSQKPAAQSAPKPSPKPAPPAPKLPKPTEVASARPTLPPNPLAPQIKVPTPSNPKTATTGPIMSSSSGSGSSGGSAGSGTPGPQQIPGTVSRNLASTSPSTGGAGGAGGGGRNAFNQGGSPGGGGGRAGVDALPEPDFGPYIAELQRRIKRNWRPPTADNSKRVVAMFTIAKDGRLLNLSVQQTSGTKVVDDAALSAVRLSAPFPPLPAGHRDNSVQVQFTFDYDVYSGGRIN